MIAITESNKRLLTLLSAVIWLGTILFITWIGGWFVGVAQIVVCLTLTLSLASFVITVSNNTKASVMMSMENGCISEEKWKKYVVDFANRYQSASFWISIVVNVLIVAALWKTCLVWILGFYCAAIIIEESFKHRLYNYMKDDYNLNRAMAASFLVEIDKLTKGITKEDKE